MKNILYSIPSPDPLTHLADVEMAESTDAFDHVQLSGFLLHLPDDLHLAVHVHQFILSGLDCLVNVRFKFVVLEWLHQ